jgi:hypothetical protein
MEKKIMNNKFTAHPFAQLASTEVELVSGGSLKGDIRLVTMKAQEDGAGDGSVFTTALGEDGNGPIYTTQAVGEEGGDLPPVF